ncbi:MAG: DUF4132 domain-containing protein [Labilithrix sp.]|nr:DUF4132 domain-containing protein [Labilithrix sp.]MCW5813290.1 DUF4132 domain-containing protein [Labilithrix sp.]
MRRFELSEGTSNKFWQVAIEDGKTLHVSFGKIGTKGQTQRKDFAAPPAATAEMEKLIREKTKKGYKEVAPPPASPAPAPSAPAPPLGAPLSSKGEAAGDRVFWTPAAKAILEKQRGEAAKAIVPSATGAGVVIAERVRAAMPLWEKAKLKWEASETADVRAKLEAGYAEEPLPATIDPDVEAAGCTLAGYDDDHRAAWVERWLALGGPAVALDVLSRMWSYYRHYDSSGARDAMPTWVTRVAPERSWDSSVCGAKTDVAEVLARHCRALEPAERAAMRAAAVKLRAGAPLTVRIGLATAVDDAALANEDAAEVLALPRDQVGYDAKVLFRLVDDPKTLEGLAARFGLDWTFKNALAVERIGLAATPLLVKQLEEAGSRDAEVAVATVLATLEHAETARVFGGWLHKKGVDAVARDFFTRRPDLALPVLKGIVASRGKNIIFAESLLKVLGAAPAPATEAMPAADAAELPRVLVEPPWLATPPKPPPIIEGITLPFGPERIDEEMAKASRTPVVAGASVKSWFAATAKLEPKSAAMDLAARSMLDGLSRRHIGSWLELMSDAAARQVVIDAASFDEMSLATVEVADLRYALARFGLDALPLVLNVAKANGPGAAEALSMVESPRAAVAVAAAAARSKKARPKAVAYFAKYPAASAHGLLPAALSKRTQKTHAPAVKVLAAVDEAAVRAAAAKEPRVLAALDAILAWDGPPPKIAPLPAWLDPKALPPVVLRAASRRLPETAVRHLLTLLALSEPRDAHPLLADVIAACTGASLARFAWALFETWLTNGAPAPEDWMMTALGHLGGDEAARRLTPFVRAWPGESAHARAVKGLDVLAEIGTDVALMHLDAIAEKLKFKGLQEKAREKIEDIADARGLTRDELADRIAPALDLDPDGSRVLSFGARSFRVGWGEDLVPFVVDETKRKSADLPKPKASDDKAAAAEATATWKALKKDAKAVASSQILRLERAMCTERRWSGADFERLLVAHPLVFHLVRRLVWAIYEEDAVTKTFRVAEDRTLADVNDDPFSLAGDAVVGLPHRLVLADADLRAWGEVFGNYEIIQPFAQLDREVFAVTEPERAAKELARVKGVEVPTGKVLGLEQRGWKKGVPQDAGWIWDVEKELPRGLRATLPLEGDGGLLAGAMAESPPEQKLGAVVVRGRDGVVALGDLPRIVFSELVRDLEGLRA